MEYQDNQLKVEIKIEIKQYIGVPDFILKELLLEQLMIEKRRESPSEFFYFNQN